jgi:hypothetical protein
MLNTLGPLSNHFLHQHTNKQLFVQKQPLVLANMLVHLNASERYV